MEKKNPKTVGAKEGLGIGIVGLGVVFFMLPSVSSALSTTAGQGYSSAFSIITGCVYVFGLVTLLAGIAVIVAKFDDDQK